MFAADLVKGSEEEPPAWAQQVLGGRPREGPQGSC